MARWQSHINQAREISTQKHMGLTEFMPKTRNVESFAAFCGHSVQRYAIGLHGIARSAGLRAIIVIHDDEQLESLLGNTVARGWQNPRFVSQTGTGGKCYDPLYGMKRSAILNTLAPAQNLNAMGYQPSDARAALQDYLSIMEAQYAAGIPTFGDYPYNLNLLLQLVEMPFEVLDRTVLASLPDRRLAESIRMRLSASGMQQQAHRAVEDFATLMADYLWRRTDFSQHSCISMASVAAANGFISIRVPNSNKPVMDYLAAELNNLIETGSNTLIVAAGVNVGCSENMLSLFLLNHRGKNYSTGILAAAVMDALGSHNEEFPALLKQHRETVVFQCHNVQDAEPFCNAVATYFQTFSERHSDTHRDNYRLFSSSTSSGSSAHQVEMQSIRPNELVDIGEGALVWDPDYQAPTLVTYFDCGI